MRILHVCLAAFYIDGYAYQENILPRKHKEQGHDVYILASCETYIDNQKLGYIKPSVYMNEYGIQITRVPYLKYIPRCIAKKIRIYEGVMEYLNLIHPEFIFLHDIQFLSIKTIVDYKKSHPEVVLVADGHADYINSGRGIISKYILHGMIYKHYIKKAEPYIYKFYGTMQIRNEFMKEMYGIPINKLEYLPLGIDEKNIPAEDFNDAREELIQKYGLNKDDYIVVTGGKFDDGKKDIIQLVNAISEMEECALLIFGSFSGEIAVAVEEKCSERIKYIGWLCEKERLQVLAGCNIAAYPYTHSVLWEETVGIGTPILVKRIYGFTHLNLNDNCIFLDSCEKEEIIKVLEMVKKNDAYLRKNACEIKSMFYYDNIAKKVLNVVRYE